MVAENLNFFCQTAIKEIPCSDSGKRIMGNASGRNLGDHPSQPNQYPEPNHPPLQNYPPVPSPYHHQSTWASPPLPYIEDQKVATIRNDINLKKETLRFEPDEENPGKFLLSFTFDASVSGSITVMFFAKESEDCNLTATKEDEFPSSTFSFTKGLGQKYKQPCGTGIEFSALSETELLEASLTNIHHVAVKAESSENNHPNSQINHIVLEKEGDEYKARVAKQILWVNGHRYELQDIYGEDGNEYKPGNNCVICLSEPQDTTVLPCRHTCMCSSCAKLLKFQTNRCPVCKQPIDRLLGITYCNDSANQ